MSIMATELRRSFKEKAKERLSFGFRLKRSTTEGAGTSGSPLGEDGEEGRSSGPHSAPPEDRPREHPQAHGHLNLLAWENLPPPIRDQLEDPKHTKDPEPSSEGRGKENKRRPRSLAKPKGSLEYIVSGTDTLASIAAQFDTTITELKKLNRLMSQMVFTGQTLYVPDKNYIPSDPSTPESPPEPLSPLQSPDDEAEDSSKSESKSPFPDISLPKFTWKDIPLVRQLRGPGLATRLGSDGDENGAVRPLSDEDARRLDDECHERFIKVNVKHITDGQGVVRGVLLVTPNAIMFDPDVSDPLVMEHGPDMYGMITPMETIISAAMYHDIAAMKKDTPCSERATKHAVYHAQGCPLYQPDIQNLDKKEKSETDGETGDKDGTVRPAVREDEYRLEAKESQSLSESQPVVCESQPAVGESQPAVGESQPAVGERQPAVGESQMAVGESQMAVGESQTGTGPAALKSVTKEEDGCSCGASPSLVSGERVVPEEGSGAPEQGGAIRDRDSTKAAEEPKDSLPGEQTDKPSFVTPSTNKPADLLITLDEAASHEGALTSRLEDANSTDAVNANTQVIISGTDDTNASHSNTDSNQNKTSHSGSSPLATQTAYIMDFASEGVKVVLRRNKSNPQQDHGEKSDPVEVPQTSRPGIFNRISGSFGSITSGSFPGSPNFSSIVDFSSGLFARSTDCQVKDVNDIPPGSGSPGRSPLQDLEESHPDLSETDGTTETHHGELIRTSSSKHDTECDLDKADMEKGAHRKHSIELEVESAIKLEDKPDLFRSLDGKLKCTCGFDKANGQDSELIPRPAKHLADPPLYLCLKIGRPINRKVSKTCPIESYMKNRKKPEYWFSIPRENVDQLYAFFVQWSPNVYGSEEEIDPRARGFVVVKDSEGDEDWMEISDDHFKTDRKKTKSKDWESLSWSDSHFSESPLASYEVKHVLSTPSTDEQIINVDEVRRRLSAAEVENLPFPDLSDPSAIMDDYIVRKLSFHLPPRAEAHQWALLFSTEKHGYSLKTLYRKTHKLDTPLLLLVKDTNNEIFGSMLPCTLKMSDSFYGTGESFLFTFFPDNTFKRFNWTGSNNFFVKGNAESLSIGAGEGSFGLWLDGDLYHGRTQSCQTYDNEILTEREDFFIKTIECWGFI